MVKVFIENFQRSEEKNISDKLKNCEYPVPWFLGIFLGIGKYFGLFKY